MAHRLRPSPRSERVLLAALAAAAWLVLGCAGPRIAVLVDEPGRHGWGERSPTWSWAPEAGPWVAVPADHRERSDPRLAGLVSRALGARGLVRNDADPDVHVRYQLEVRRTAITTYEQLPPRSITGSLVRGEYVVSGVARVTREYDDVRLEIRVHRAADGQPLWAARLRERLAASDGAELEGAVASVFERFPAAPSTTAAR